MKKRGLNLPSERAVKGNASLWKRISAFFIDLVILNLIVFYPFKGFIQKIIPIGSYKESYQFLMAHTKLTGTLSAISVIMALLGILYFVLLEYKLNQSVGKVIMNIYVTSEEKQLGFWQCVVRSMFLIPAFPFIILWVLDPLSMFFTAKNQRLSEILSRTRTVEDFMV